MPISADRSLQLALKYAGDMEEFMPRSEIDKYKTVIAKALKKADPDCAHLKQRLHTLLIER
jgi:hypothetical protein